MSTDVTQAPEVAPDVAATPPLAQRARSLAFAAIPYAVAVLAAFVVVCVAVIVFRYRKPDEPRTFRLPFMPFVPAFGVLASGFLISQLHWETWLRFGIWLVVGLVLYFGYGRRHSLLNPDSPRLPR